MAINTTVFESTLQIKLDDTTLANKDMLLLGKALESTIGNIAVSDINTAGTAQVGLVTAEGTAQVGLVTVEGTAQVGLVTVEGTAQVGLVTAEGTAQVALVQAAAPTMISATDIGSTVQAYDADTSKTDVAETRSASINMADNVLQRPELKDYSETNVAMSANDADLSLGNVFTKTISGATTLTFSNPPASGKAGAFTLIVTLSGSPTITWPSSVKWAGGTAPTLTSAGTDIFTFMTTNGGTTWYGFTAGQDLT